MGVRILFLGPLRDLAGQDECEVAAPLGWDGLLAAVNPAVLFTPRLDRALVAWVEKHYPDRLSTKDLLDPALARRCLDALDELTGILKLPGLYPFQG